MIASCKGLSEKYWASCHLPRDQIIQSKKNLTRGSLTLFTASSSFEAEDTYFSIYPNRMLVSDVDEKRRPSPHLSIIQVDCRISTGTDSEYCSVPGGLISSDARSAL